MILVDTSIWIDYFKGNLEICDSIDLLIETGKIVTTELVFAELLQGARDNSEIEILSHYWKSLPKFDSKIMTGAFYSAENKLRNKGIGIIDAIIIACIIENNFQIWTLDKKILNFLDKKYIYP